MIHHENTKLEKNNERRCPLGPTISPSDKSKRQMAGLDAINSWWSKEEIVIWRGSILGKEKWLGPRGGHVGRAKQGRDATHKNNAPSEMSRIFPINRGLEFIAKGVLMKWGSTKLE